jgi:hypothetical protein
MRRKRMKLSTELALTNLVLLGALYYVVFQTWFATALLLLTLMFMVRMWSISVQRKERAAEMAAAKARLRAIIDRKFKDAP